MKLAFKIRLCKVDFLDFFSSLREAIRHIAIQLLRKLSLKLFKLLRICLIRESLLHHALELLLSVALVLTRFLSHFSSDLGHRLCCCLNTLTVLLPVFVFKGLDSFLHQLLLFLFELLVDAFSDQHLELQETIF
jgi:hypothetical protein